MSSPKPDTRSPWSSEGPAPSGELEGDVLGAARRLHPEAKRGLMIAWGQWGQDATGEAIFDSMADGVIDHFLVRPGKPPDELFHQAVSSLLLEWAEARREAPYTIEIVGSSWSGRAYELRAALQRCAIPHSFHLADSPRGERIVEAAGDSRGLPLVAFPDGTILADPSSTEMARAAGSPVHLESIEFDVIVVGRRSRRPLGGCLRSVRGLQHARRRRGRTRRPGNFELAHPQLPRIPPGHQRPAPRPAGVRPGVGLRREIRVHARSHRHRANGERTYPAASRTAARPLPRRCSRHGSRVPAPGRARAGGPQRRRSVLWRARIGGSWADRSRCLRARGRQLCGASSAAPRPTRAVGDARGQSGPPGGGHVGLPGAANRSHAHHRGPAGNGDRGRWR